MRSSDLIASGLALTLVQTVCAPAADEPKSPPAAGVASAPAEAGKPVALASSDLGGLDALLPVGKTARKVVVPSIDEDGLLTSVTRMGKITRISEDHFALENVLLTTFDVEKTDPATGKPEATAVKISKGVYVSSEKKLISDRPVRVSKPGVEIIGESLVYWSLEGRALLKGPSETILTGLQAPAPRPDAGDPTAPDAGPPEDPDPDSDSTPDPEVLPKPEPQ